MVVTAGQMKLGGGRRVNITNQPKPGDLLSDTPGVAKGPSLPDTVLAVPPTGAEAPKEKTKETSKDEAPKSETKTPVATEKEAPKVEAPKVEPEKAPMAPEEGAKKD